MTSIAIDRLDGLSSATAVKGPTKVATVANITLSGHQTMDGVAVVTGDRVLVKDQTDQRENGIYVCDSGNWRRAKDFSGNRDVQKGTRVWVSNGAIGPAEYVVTTDNPIRIGTSLIVFALSRREEPGAPERYAEEFGFIDDSTTPNDEAWALAKSVLTNGETLIFTRILDGVYYYATTSNFTGLNIALRDDTTFTGPNVYQEGGISVKSGKLTLNNTGIETSFDLFPDPFLREKQDFITDGDVANELPIPIDMSLTTLQQYSWPNAATSTALSTGVSAGVEGVTFDLSTVPTNAMLFVGSVAEAACQYSWVMSASSSADSYAFAIIAFETGYHAIYGTHAGGAAVKKLTSAGVYTETTLPPFLDLATQPGYYFARASITVDLITPTRYQLAINGVSVLEADLPSPATYVGPGTYTGSNVSQYVFALNMCKTRNPTQLAPRPMRALISGDSKTDDVFVGWPFDVSRVLQDSMGTQWEFHNNIAVAGQTLAQQKAILLATNLTGYTDCIIALGTNDSQATTNTATFTSNLEDMLDYVADLRVTLLLTPQFYDRADAVANGGIGQASQNSVYTSQYREIIRRTAADYIAAGARIAVVDAGKILGPALAAYLSWSGANSLVDTVEFDNIHEGRRARKKIGHAIARAMLGLAGGGKRTKAYPLTAWPTSWYATDWAAHATAGIAPRYGYSEDGSVILRGVLQYTGVGVPDGSTIATLPVHLRPGRVFRHDCTVSLSNVQIIVQTNGQILLYGASAMTNPAVHLDGVRYSR